MPNLAAFIPPILLDAYRRTRTPVRRFFGPYEKFEAIPVQVPWASDSYLETARAALAKAADSKTLPPDPVPTCLTTMMVDLLSHPGPCKVLDFGGGAGITYFRIRPHLTRPENVSWYVVDNPRLAEVGRNHAKPADRMEFLEQLPAAGTPYDLVHVNTALQYLSDWKEVVTRPSLSYQSLC